MNTDKLPDLDLFDPRDAAILLDERHHNKHSRIPRALVTPCRVGTAWFVNFGLRNAGHAVDYTIDLFNSVDGWKAERLAEVLHREQNVDVDARPPREELKAPQPDRERGI